MFLVSGSCLHCRASSSWYSVQLALQPVKAGRLEISLVPSTFLCHVNKRSSCRGLTIGFGIVGSLVVTIMFPFLTSTSGLSLSASVTTDGDPVPAKTSLLASCPAGVMCFPDQYCVVVDQPFRKVPAIFAKFRRIAPGGVVPGRWKREERKCRRCTWWSSCLSWVSGFLLVAKRKNTQIHRTVVKETEQKSESSRARMCGTPGCKPSPRLWSERCNSPFGSPNKSWPVVSFVFLAVR